MLRKILKWKVVQFLKILYKYLEIGKQIKSFSKKFAEHLCILKGCKGLAHLLAVAKI